MRWPPVATSTPTAATAALDAGLKIGVVEPDEAFAELRGDIDNALAKHPPHERTDSMTTGWVIVAEFMDSDGKKWLSRADSQGMTQWLREGMLWDALNSDEWDTEAVD